MATKNITTRTPEQAAIVSALKTPWPQVSVLSSTPRSRLTARNDGSSEVLSVERKTGDGAWLEIGRYDADSNEQRAYAESAYAALVKAESGASGSAETCPYDADHLPNSTFELDEALNGPDSDAGMRARNRIRYSNVEPWAAEACLDADLLPF